jgi:cytochrome oxidase Cu insertion factor (SCO1/SenC/PrrC family)
MTGRWSYLIGSPSQLEPVWKSYYVAAQLLPSTEVIHTAAVYVIDKQGRERVYLDGGDFLPDELVHDLRLLMAE